MSLKRFTTAAAKMFVLAAAACPIAGAAFAPTLAFAEDGASLFADNCAACHQPKGQGVAGAYPPLAGNKFVLGDPKGPAYVLTHGRGGMPNFSDDLDDKQIAAILSYIRTSWGNTAAALDPSAVAAQRGAAAPPNQEAGLPFH